MTVLVAIVLLACASREHPIDRQYSLAIQAIADRQWERAYRLIEDGLDWPDPSFNERARSVVARHPELLRAAISTFSAEQIRSTMAAHGSGRGINIERSRLAQYRTVASLSAYETAKRQVDYEAKEVDAGRRRAQAEAVAEAETKTAEEALKAEGARRSAEAELGRQADLARRHAQVAADLAQARHNNELTCRNQTECDRMFALGQAYVIEQSDMKIQVATNTLIETHNGTSNGQVSFRLLRIPSVGESWRIVMSATCREEGGSALHLCNAKPLRAYSGFHPYLAAGRR